eukprot:2749178-Prymnesium_polylepis.2
MQSTAKTVDIAHTLWCSSGSVSVGTGVPGTDSRMHSRYASPAAAELLDQRNASPRYVVAAGMARIAQDCTLRNLLGLLIVSRGAGER